MPTVEDIVLDPPGEDGVVDPKAWFATPGPFELEIGSGKGGFLLARARAAPDVRLLGIEWANKYFRYCADRMARWQLTNVRVMRADARHFVMHHLPPACVSVLHVYHPDPWPKKRHHKRRLFQPEFAEAVARVLAEDGACLVQSDHAEYFAHIREVLTAHPLLYEVPWATVAVDAGAEWAGTNFEIKYARDHRPIQRLAVRRHPGPLNSAPARREQSTEPPVCDGTDAE